MMVVIFINFGTFLNCLILKYTLVTCITYTIKKILSEIQLRYIKTVNTEANES